MCNVKEGAEVKTRADLQNLVTSVILRQTDVFTLDDIVKAANTRLYGSTYFKTKELEDRCADTVKTLFLIGSIDSTSKNNYKLAMPWPAISKR